MTCPSCRAPTPDAQPFCAHCGARLASADASDDAATRTAAHPPEALDTGTTFAGRYQIIEELGRGGMGRVYKVIDQEVHAKVALKLIRPEIAADQPTIDRFRQELTTARGISHKNICRMHDLGRHGSTYFLTMEYVSGEDLKSMIAMSGQLGVGTALSIAKQVCDGLGEAHRLDVIHRDLKPQNIQIDKGGQAKIMDFGIARSVRGKGLTDAGIAIGTSQYMAPEQAEARDVDARSDLYALGVILYEMLTGHVPFDGDTPLAVAMQHKLETPRDPRDLNASIPADLAGVILRCLEKHPEKRYQSASEVHAELVRIEQGLPTTSQVVPQQRPATSKEITVHVTMRQLRVPALVLVALVAVGLGAWWLWPRHAPSAAADASTAATGKPMLAVLYFENISGDPTLNTLRMSLPELLMTTLSQSRLLNVVPSDSIFSILKRLKLADAARYSTSDLLAVAKEANAQYLLAGSVMKVGQQTIVTVRMQKASTGDLVTSEKIESLKDEELLPKLDAMAGRIKASLNLSPQAIASDISLPIGQVLTSSPEALKFYTQAVRLHLNLDYPAAIPMYLRAIEADPRFAMAYRGVASVYSNVGDRPRRDAALEKALELSDRLPERYRDEIQITAYYASTNTWPQGIDACHTLLAKYPDDVVALNYLGSIYVAGEDYEKAVGFREAAAKVSPTYLYVYNLGMTYAALGQTDKAEKAIEAYLERDPGNVDAHLLLASAYSFDGNFAEAQREFDAALVLDPRRVSASPFRGDLAMLRGDFAASEREYLSLAGDMAQTEVVRRGAGVRLGLLHLTQGRFENARAEVRASTADGPPDARLGWVELETGRPDLAARTFQGLLADPVTASDPRVALTALWGLGLARAATGDGAGAQKALDDLKARRQGLFVKPATRLSLSLSGALATNRGAGQPAVADLERAASMLALFYNTAVNPTAVTIDLLARAYAAAGNLAKARETYERIAAMTFDRVASGATWARSFYHLGLIAEKQGDKARAREQFRKFLEIWKDADQGLPEIADAKRRMVQ